MGTAGATGPWARDARGGYPCKASARRGPQVPSCPRVGAHAGRDRCKRKRPPWRTALAWLPGAACAHLWLSDLARRNCAKRAPKYAPSETAQGPAMEPARPARRRRTGGQRNPLSTYLPVAYGSFRLDRVRQAPPLSWATRGARRTRQRAGAADGPVFGPADRHGTVHSARRSEPAGRARSLKPLAATAKLDPRPVSGHRLRLGRVPTAARRGARGHASRRPPQVAAGGNAGRRHGARDSPAPRRPPPASRASALPIAPAASAPSR